MSYLNLAPPDRLENRCIILSSIMYTNTCHRIFFRNDDFLRKVLLKTPIPCEIWNILLRAKHMDTHVKSSAPLAPVHRVPPSPNPGSCSVSMCSSECSMQCDISISQPCEKVKCRLMSRILSDCTLVFRFL